MVLTIYIFLSTHIQVLLIHSNTSSSKIFKLWRISFFCNTLDATSTLTIGFRFNFIPQILMCWIYTLLFIHIKMYLLNLWVWAIYVYDWTQIDQCPLNMFVMKSTFNLVYYMNSNIWPSWLNMFHSLIKLWHIIPSIYINKYIKITTNVVITKQ